MDLNFGTWFLICLTLVLLKFNLPNGKRKSLLTRLYAYFCGVVESAKKRKATDSKNAAHVTVKKLENYSQKMMRLSEECAMTDPKDPTDYDENCESDFEGPPEKRTISIQTLQQTQTEECEPDPEIVIVPEPEAPLIVQIPQQTQTDKCEEETEVGRASRAAPLETKENFHEPEKPRLGIKQIRRIQEIQINGIAQDLRFLNSDAVKTPLLIAVETSVTNFAGYCINFETMTCKFYSYKNMNLPWKVESIPTPSVWDCSELKIKNLTFALLLWGKDIKEMKKYSIYSNCPDINHPDSEYGRVAIELMEHLGYCENVVRVNSNPVISKYKDTEAFALLMQPARELAFWNLARFRAFVQKAYGIRNFEGSHMFLDNYSDAAKEDGYFTRSFRYDQFLTKVKKNLKTFTRCGFCGFHFSRHFGAKAVDSGSFENLFSDIVP